MEIYPVVRSTKIASGITTVVAQAGVIMPPVHGSATFQAYGTTTSGAGAATIKIDVSNVDSPGTNDWINAGTITLTLGTTSTTDGFTLLAPWVWVRSNVTAISGTGASVSVIMGV